MYPLPGLKRIRTREGFSISKTVSGKTWCCIRSRRLHGIKTVFSHAAYIRSRQAFLFRQRCKSHILTRTRGKTCTRLHHLHTYTRHTAPSKRRPPIYYSEMVRMKAPQAWSSQDHENTSLKANISPSASDQNPRRESAHNRFDKHRKSYARGNMVQITKPVSKFSKGSEQSDKTNLSGCQLQAAGSRRSAHPFPPLAHTIPKPL